MEAKPEITSTQDKKKERVSLNDFDKVELFSSKLDDYRENVFFTLGFMIIYFIGLWAGIFEIKIPLIFLIFLALFFFLVNLTVWFIIKKYGKLNLVIHYFTLLLDVIMIWLVLFVTGGIQSHFFIFIFIFVFAVSLRYPLRDSIIFSGLSLLSIVLLILVEHRSGTLTPTALYTGVVYFISTLAIAVISYFLSYTYKRILRRMQLKDRQLEGILNEMRYQQKEVEETNINMNRIIQ
ncbi:MAG TPA: hypothetical protein ENN73_04330, partial [Firmicutes bacterium]|nr:hypothetical protein [Bacillota bacterium]